MFEVASIQLEISDHDTKGQRISHVEELMDEVSGVDLIVLPEIWNIGYFSFDLYHKASETLEGETVSRMAQKAESLGAYVLAGSIVERAGGKLFNTSVLLDRRGKIVATYRKIHLFGYGSKEQTLLSPGEKTAVVRTELGVFGLSTCYDLRFPELYRRMIDEGAEIFLVTAAWPYPRLEHWMALNQVRAFENQCFLISSNCVGHNRGKQFLGHSMVVDPWGIILASGGDFECIVKTEMDLDVLYRARAEFPPLRDRVIEI